MLHHTVLLDGWEADLQWKTAVCWRALQQGKWTLHQHAECTESPLCRHLRNSDHPSFRVWLKRAALFYLTRNLSCNWSWKHVVDNISNIPVEWSNARFFPMSHSFARIPGFVLPSHLPVPQAASHWRLLSICQPVLWKPSCPPQAPRQRLCSGSHSRSPPLPAVLRALAESRMNPEHATRCSHNQRRKTTSNCEPFLRDRTGLTICSCCWHSHFRKVTWSESAGLLKKKKKT